MAVKEKHYNINNSIPSIVNVDGGMNGWIITLGSNNQYNKQITTPNSLLAFYRQYPSISFTVKELQNICCFKSRTSHYCKKLEGKGSIKSEISSTNGGWNKVSWYTSGFKLTVDRVPAVLLLFTITFSIETVPIQNTKGRVIHK